MGPLSPVGQSHVPYTCWAEGHVGALLPDGTLGPGQAPGCPWPLRPSPAGATSLWPRSRSRVCAFLCPNPRRVPLSDPFVPWEAAEAWRK